MVNIEQDLQVGQLFVFQPEEVVVQPVYDYISGKTPDSEKENVFSESYRGKLYFTVINGDRYEHWVFQETKEATFLVESFSLDCPVSLELPNLGKRNDRWRTDWQELQEIANKFLITLIFQRNEKPFSLNVPDFPGDLCKGALVAADPKLKACPKYFRLLFMPKIQESLRSFLGAASETLVKEEESMTQIWHFSDQGLKDLVLLLRPLRLSVAGSLEDAGYSDLSHAAANFQPVMVLRNPRFEREVYAFMTQNAVFQDLFLSRFQDRALECLFSFLKRRR